MMNEGLMKSKMLNQHERITTIVLILAGSVLRVYDDEHGASPARRNERDRPQGLRYSSGGRRRDHQSGG